MGTHHARHQFYVQAIANGYENTQRHYMQATGKEKYKGWNRFSAVGLLGNEQQVLTDRDTDGEWIHID